MAMEDRGESGKECGTSFLFPLFLHPYEGELLFDTDVGFVKLTLNGNKTKKARLSSH